MPAAEAERSRGPLAGRLVRHRLFWPAAALIALLVLDALLIPGFLDVEVRGGRAYGALVDIAHRAAPLVLVALGMTVVIGTGGIDLSVGAVVALAGTAAALALESGGGAGAAVAVALAAGLAAGLFNGALVAGLRLQPIVATLILFTAGRGLAQLLSGGRIVTFESPGFELLASGVLLGLPLTVWQALAALLLVLALMRASSFGLYVEAIGDNRSAARLAGLPVARITLAAYALASVLAAQAGMIVAADVGAADAANAGLFVELDAILVVVIGGTPLVGGRTSVAGTLLGALLLQTLTTTVLMRGWPQQLTLVVEAATVVAVVALQSPRLRELLRRRRARSAGRAGGAA